MEAIRNARNVGLIFLALLLASVSFADSTEVTLTAGQSTTFTGLELKLVMVQLSADDANIAIFEIDPPSDGTDSVLITKGDSTVLGDVHIYLEEAGMKYGANLQTSYAKLKLSEIVCGDGQCTEGEDCSSCSQDCGKCPTISCGGEAYPFATEVEVGEYVECEAEKDASFYRLNVQDGGTYTINVESLDGSPVKLFRVARYHKNGYLEGTGFCNLIYSTMNPSCTFHYDPEKDADVTPYVQISYTGYMEGYTMVYEGHTRWHSSFEAPYCGDGRCTLDECSSGCGDCSSNDCRYNSQCDTRLGESCQNLRSDCPCGEGETCAPGRDGATTSGCYGIRTGDGYCDGSHGENKETACADCGCWSEKVCDESQNKCVECLSDLNCKNAPKLHCHSERQICIQCESDTDCGGKRCDPSTFTCVGCIADGDCPEMDEWSGQLRCSADHKTVEETGIKKVGRCQHETCQYEKGSSISRIATDCRLQGTFCQENNCGCSEGYDECEASKQCVKVGNLAVNAPCDCDFQCDSGYCKAGTCIQTASVELSATKSILAIDDATTITLSVSNTLNEDATYDLVLNIGSGASMNAVLSGQSCSGNQCKLTGTIGAKSRKDLSIKVDPQQPGSVKFSADVTLSTTTGKTITLPMRELTLDIKRCGDGLCSKEIGESSETCCIDCKCPASTIFYKHTCRQTACDREMQSVSMILIGVFVVFGLIPAILLVVFRRQAGQYWTDRRKHAQEAEEMAKAEAAKAEQGRLSFEKLYDRVKELIERRDHGRGVSFRRIRNSIPGETDVRIWDVIAELLKDNEIEEIRKDRYRISTVRADNLLSLVEEKDRGRGVSLRRLTRFSDLPEEDLKKALDRLKKSKKVEERRGKYWIR